MCDVRDAEQVDGAIGATVERFGRLDIVVANAGVGAYGPFLELDPAHLEEMIDVNVKGTLYTVRAALPHLLAAGEGDVVALASVAGLRGLPYEAVYCASKFAQVGFVRALDHELRERGIRCTSIEPGGVATEFAMGRGQTPDMPSLEGMMSIEDVAEVVLFALTRPHGFRILGTAFRPMTEEALDSASSRQPSQRRHPQGAARSGRRREPSSSTPLTALAADRTEWRVAQGRPGEGATLALGRGEFVRCELAPFHPTVSARELSSWQPF